MPTFDHPTRIPMKKVFLLFFALLLISLTGYSRKVTTDKVPAAVKQSFTKMFPTATDVKYGTGKKNYEIYFKDHGIEKSANFDPAGKWLETETAMRPKDLPKEVDTSVEKNFPGFSIAQVSKVEIPGTGVVYEMDLKKDKDGFEVQFSAKGDILKKVPWKEEKD
jgi:hypothetical protein